jgi:hypothetical protein
MQTIKGTNMNANFTAPISTRLTALAAALLASSTVLGATVFGMQPGEAAGVSVVALEQITVTAPAVH